MAINTFTATIQMRRGLEEDFDADKMTAGEWAVSTDKKYVRMCFAPGVVVRMATYEAFEQDMIQIQTILATCQDIQAAVDAMAQLAEQHKNDALDYANLSKSYAVGTDGSVRENDNSDCAEYYYEQTKRISQGINGIIPMGTITFEELSDPNNQQARYFFNISDSFVSDERFKDGSGIFYGAGNNVLRTADGMWDVTAASMVSGVKGNAENEYRQGFVNITAENIGAVKNDDFNNILGNTSISTIGDGTVTGAVSAINSNLLKIKSKNYTLNIGNTKDAVSQMYFGDKNINSDNPTGTILAVIPVVEGYSGWGAGGGITIEYYNNVVRCASNYSGAVINFKVYWIYK